MKIKEDYLEIQNSNDMSQILEGSEYESDSEEEESDYSSSKPKNNKIKINKQIMNSHEIKKSCQNRKKDSDTILKENLDKRIRQIKQEHYIQMNQNFKKRSKSIDHQKPITNNLQSLFNCKQNNHHLLEYKQSLSHFSRSTKWSKEKKINMQKFYAKQQREMKR